MENNSIKPMEVAVVGAGTMGMGIAQVSAMAGHITRLFDPKEGAVSKALSKIRSSLEQMQSKGKISVSEVEAAMERLRPVNTLDELSTSSLVIEAILEDLEMKRELFGQLDRLCASDSILATNTSSLMVTSVAASCTLPGRVVGMHFFNPAPLMPLVEIIPALQTNQQTVDRSIDLMRSWGKVPVVVKDTPGFIVNRLARPFYGESLRMLEEGVADEVTIDHALRTMGGFRMGPFELMDLIGNDVNYAVTETVWKQMYFDPRYRPSIIQKRMSEAGYFGRKSGRGYYDYSEGSVKANPSGDEKLWIIIFNRVISMLVNEAAEACYLRIASREELDLAMTKGVNYPHGLLKWGDTIGLTQILDTLVGLQDMTGDMRYRPSVLLRRLAAEGKGFYTD
jgi:3-hydroxybutyryl-CoA dehydrogenase